MVSEHAEQCARVACGDDGRVAHVTSPRGLLGAHHSCTLRLAHLGEEISRPHALDDVTDTYSCDVETGKAPPTMKRMSREAAATPPLLDSRFSRETRTATSCCVSGNSASHLPGRPLCLDCRQSFATRMPPRARTPAKSRKLRIIFGTLVRPVGAPNALQMRHIQKPSVLDRIQEVAGSSPASSIAERPAWLSRTVSLRP
jgi:hypothetical protein